MPVFNAGRTLSRALDSIFAQSFRDFGLYVINDGSTDGTSAILEEYKKRESRLVVVEHEKNKGLPVSLNDGITAANGDLILRADADDYNFPDRFEKQVSFLRAHPEVDVLGGAMERVNSKGEVFSVTRQPETDAEIKRKLYLRVPFFHPTVALRKTFWERNGGYDSRWPHCEDVDLWLRGYKNAVYHNLPDILVRYQAPLVLKTTRQLEVFRMLLVNGRKNGDLFRSLLAVAKFSTASIYFKIFQSKYFSPE
jgi:glycosyltransferase involved in cell wall biosynthesis